MDIVVENMPYFLRSFGFTVIYSFFTLIVASIFGAIVAIIYTLVEKSTVQRMISILINIIRGLPLLVVLFAVYYILPFFGVDLPRAVAALAGLTVFFAASIAEVFRGAIQSVPAIQVDVAKALSMKKWQRLRHVVFPQAIRLILGPMIGEFVRIVKGSTLLSLLTIPELMLAAREVTTASFKGIQIYGTVGIMYFLFIYACSQIGQKIEGRYAFER